MDPYEKPPYLTYQYLSLVSFRLFVLPRFELLFEEALGDRFYEETHGTESGFRRSLMKAM